ncbi:hypothetical protein FBB35_19700 [Nostoc sp. TCL240-02]|nr:hypothetical protein FBB35_19700 [Nostoc sp. TCL240-02]
MLELLTHCVRKANIGKKAIATGSWRVRHRAHALQNDSVKVVIKMDDALTQPRPVPVNLDST